MLIFGQYTYPTNWRDSTQPKWTQKNPTSKKHIPMCTWWNHVLKCLGHEVLDWDLQLSLVRWKIAIMQVWLDLITQGVNFAFKDNLFHQRCFWTTKKAQEFKTWAIKRHQIYQFRRAYLVLKKLHYIQTSPFCKDQGHEPVICRTWANSQLVRLQSKASSDITDSSFLSFIPNSYNHNDNIQYNMCNINCCQMIPKLENIHLG